MLVPEANLVDRIHSTPTKAVLYITGGGTGIFKTLLHRGGGSATLIDGRIPYAEQETIELLGGTPEKFVSEQTTRQLAMAAFQKALKRSNGEEPVIGIACSSSLQRTPTEREGRLHYIFVALQTEYKTISLSLEIPKASAVFNSTAESIRISEEKITETLILNLIAEGCGLEDRVFIGKFVDNNIVRRESTLYHEFLPDLLKGTLTKLLFDPGRGLILGLTGVNVSKKLFVLPGSFNPASPAHFEMADLVDQFQNGTTQFEISIRNVDKPMLDLITLEERLATTGNRQVWITNAPLFIEKAKAFPGATFVVGYDTATRICAVKYAGEVSGVLDVFQAEDSRFIVFGRTINGKYENDQSAFPPRFKTMAIFYPAALQNAAVSSTEIRRSQGA